MRRSYLKLAGISLAYALPLITTNTITSITIFLAMGMIQIENRVYLSVWNSKAKIRGLDSDTKSGIYISALDGAPSLHVEVTESVSNGGIMSFNSSLSTDGASNYKFYGITNIYNYLTGQMFFSNSNGMNQSTASISCNYFSNYGTLTFHKDSTPNGIVNIQANTFQNYGDIYLYNQNLDMAFGMSQSGCIHIQGSSRLTIPANPCNNVTTQVFYLDGPNAELIIPSTTLDTIVVGGLGNGNLISSTEEVFFVGYEEQLFYLYGEEANLLAKFELLGDYNNFAAFSVVGCSITYTESPPSIDPGICNPAPPILIAPPLPEAV